MGRLHYGSSQVFEFDDLVLAHIRSIVFSKFNHQESFGLTWISDGQQRSVWLHPSTDVVFEFDEPTTPELDHEWLSEMRAQAGTRVGLRIADAPREGKATRWSS
ncbi:MAG: DUF7882 family protein [Agrococcus casei]|uniref:DUF7882 family protein n=1 Tax=Agrococcus casei TaxID=343512 RepID=UPI003F91D263